MATSNLSGPPTLSTPDHILDESANVEPAKKRRRLSDGQIHHVYEIERTVSAIHESKWQRVALQFPDEMLPDAVRVFELLEQSLLSATRPSTSGYEGQNLPKESSSASENLIASPESLKVKLCILADTSYGACCVDEVAAEHIDADVVVHYGRTCLSPTSRLPVLHVFTEQPLDLDQVRKAFAKIYPNKDELVFLTADVPFSSHVDPLHKILEEDGYVNVFPAKIKHDPSSLVPNRSVPSSVETDADQLKAYHLFHISEPPASLLLTLSSRMASVCFFPTNRSGELGDNSASILSSTPRMLQRRYALITRLATASIFGILVNTLSVKNYMHMVDFVKARIAEAGKKSYTFVVGKVNAAKVANFSEVDGWVVIGCWESSLIDSKDFWKPILTPFELTLALQSDDQRLWTGEWSSDFQKILNANRKLSPSSRLAASTTSPDSGEGGLGSEEDSAPPEFDLRTGRYVSRSRPMRASVKPNGQAVRSSSELIKRSNGDIATIGGQVSPAAEFLRSQRTWTGLGSDFEIAYEEEGSQIEQGRAGIARGYTVGNGLDKT